MSLNLKMTRSLSEHSKFMLVRQLWISLSNYPSKYAEHFIPKWSKVAQVVIRMVLFL